MRKLILLSCSVFLASACMAQLDHWTGKMIINSYVTKAYGAKSLHVSYTVQQLGGVPEQYTLTLSKPNLARIETPYEVTVVNGSTITSFNKSDKTYYRVPENHEALVKLFRESDIHLWAAFFEPKAFSNVPEASNTGTRVRDGMKLIAVKTALDMSNDHFETFYFDESGIPRQAEINMVSEDTTTLLNTLSLQLGDDDIPSSEFAFNVPPGSRELTVDEVKNGKWFDTIEDALLMAKATGRLVLVEFRSVSSPISTKLENQVFRSPNFKAMSSRFVFCRVDVDEQRDEVRKYQVKGVPDIRFLKSTGQQIATNLGFIAAPQLVAKMQQIADHNP